MKGAYIGFMLVFVFLLMAGGLMRWVAFISHPKKRPFRSEGDRWGFWLSFFGVAGMVVVTIIYENFSEY